MSQSREYRPKKEFCRMTVTRQTYDLIMKACVEEYLAHHKDMRKYMTQDLICEKIAEFYLE